MSNMFSELDKLTMGLDAAWKRSEVIANNIANVDTPNFNRSSVEFEDYYKAALSSEGSFTLRRTRSGHFDTQSPSDVEPRVVTDTSTTMRMDGNNVDVEKEMSDLAVNTIYYQTLLTKASAEVTQLQTAIKGS